MPTPKTPQRIRLDELLADGEWHDRALLIAGTVGVIAPGVAPRHARKMRRDDRAGHLRRRGGVPGTHKGGGPGTADDVRVGARALVTRTILTAVRSGAYERRERLDTVQIRRRPETGGE